MRRQVIGAVLSTVCAAWGQEEIEVAKQNLDRLLETRRLISQEQRDWRVAKELLADRVGVLDKELASMREKCSQVTNEAGKLDQQFAETGQQNDELAAAVSHMRDSVAAFENRVRPLLARAPEPVRERVKPLAQRLPEDPRDTKVSLPERFQNVIGILNEIGKANGEITVATEIRNLGDGRPIEVKTLYVGMGQAYYVSAKGEAGIGKPGTAGWEWAPANEIAARVTDAMQILQNKATPTFVPLPVRIP